MNGFGFVEAEEAVVDEDRVEAGTDGLVHEFRRNGRVDATAYGADDLTFGSHEGANARDFFVDEGGHCPMLPSSADLDGKVFEDFGPFRGVGHFGMELDAVIGFRIVGYTGEGSVRCGCYGGETIRETVRRELNQA